MHTNRFVSSLLVVGALVAAASGIAAAADKAKPVETISARVISLSAGPGPNTGVLYIWIDRYTTDDDAQRWVDVLVKEGQDALVRLWQKEDVEVGRVRPSGTIAYGLRVARSRPTETGRKLILVTDRPIAGFELRRGARSMDYPVAWIELDLDAKGEGSGRMIPAAEVSVENNTLQLKSLGVEPLRLTGVKVGSD